MSNLSRATYRKLYESLRSYEDVSQVARETGLDPELLFVIYTHRVTRDATKRFYVVKNRSAQLLKEWQRGRSYLDLAREWNFPPVLMAQMVERERQTPRKVFWDGFRHPEAIPDPRLRREVQEVLAHDWIYSPKGGELQRERGRKGEQRLAQWLHRHGLTYRTEKDLRGKFAKTPDALLDRPIGIEGHRVAWIESKANFGDDVELRRNLRKQLEPYVRMFGEGLVVYWYGHIQEAEPVPGILIYDGDRFEQLVPTEPPPETRSPSGPPTGGSTSAPPRPPPRPEAPPPTSGRVPPRRRTPVDRSAYF
jgi:hypothetical protein